MIQSITLNANKRLVPLSEYKGPILKLTQKDKEEIDVINKQIVDKEADLYKLNLLKMQSLKIKSLFDYYSYKILDIHTDVDLLKNKIKTIKMNRLEQQIKKCKKM